MRNKFARGSFAVALGALLVFAPVAAGAAGTVVEGELVAESAHELPAPSVALSSDGKSLIAWSDAGPGNTDGDCTTDGGSCNIVAAIVEADGTTIGDPFIISGDVFVDYYYAAPNVIWNEDLGEWLVMFTSYSTGDNGVYAQRVSASGELVGSQVALPVDQATTVADPNTIVTLPNPSDIVSANATWSPADQVYFVTWLQGGNNTGVGLANGRSLFGYFMNADLSPADGHEAVLALSENNVQIWSGLVKHDYSPTLDEWSVIWVKNADSRTKVQLTTVSYDGGEVSAPASTIAVDVSGSGLNFDDWQLSGDIIWVESLNKWVLTWGGRDVSGDPWNAFARTVDPDGTLGEPTQVTDFAETRSDTPATWMPSHNLYFDEATGMLYAAGSIEASDPAYANANNLTASVWTFDPATMQAGELVSLIAPREEGGVTNMEASSRAILSGIDGGLVVVYQNWPEGEWNFPAQVRFHKMSSVDGLLAETGPSDLISPLAAALITVGLGIATSTIVRRKSLR